MNVNVNPTLEQSSDENGAYFEQNLEESNIIQPRGTLLSQCNFTVYPSNYITHAVAGFFLSPDQIHVAVARGNVLGILEVNFESESIRTLHSLDVLGIISNLKAFPVQEVKRDAIVLTSNSGKLNILMYSPVEKRFNKIEFAYGSLSRGINNSTLHVATDYSGRAILLGPVAGKLIFLHKISNETKFTEVVLDISGYNIFHIVNLYSRTDQIEFFVFRQRTQVFDTEILPFELITYQHGRDNNLKNKFELFQEHVDLFLPVPYSSTSPGGILLFSRNKIIYRNLDSKNKEMEFFVPGRTPKSSHNKSTLNHGETNEGIIFVHTTEFFISPQLFFFAQTTGGEIFLFCLWKNIKNEVEDLKFEYVDTLPVSNALCLLGQLLFVASKFSNIVQIQQLHV